MHGTLCPRVNFISLQTQILEIPIKEKALATLLSRWKKISQYQIIHSNKQNFCMIQNKEQLIAQVMIYHISYTVYHIYVNHIRYVIYTYIIYALHLSDAFTHEKQPISTRSVC